MMAIYKRKKRKIVTSTKKKNMKTMEGGCLINKLSKMNTVNVLFCLLIAQLFCDIVSHLEPKTNGIFLRKVFANQASEDRQRLLEGPKSMEVLIGEPADLSCLIENKSKPSSWSRGTLGLGKDEVTQTFADRYSLPGPNSIVRAQQGGAPADENPASEPEPIVSNYTLHIMKVSLQDDTAFKCALSDGTNAVTRVTVLQPPTSLSLKASRLSPQTAQESIQLTQVDYIKSQPQANYTLSNESNADSEIFHIVVRQNDRIKLDCLADLAKPHAELIWLDHRQRQVLGGNTTSRFESIEPSPAAASSGESSSDNEEDEVDDMRVEELVQADGAQPKLSSAKVSLIFTAQRHHSSQIFTCLGKHRAFEQADRFPALFNRELRKQVRLEVHYKPKIELTKDRDLPAPENKPITFQCRAHARSQSNQLSYRWFIDKQLVVNASEPELRIERLSRQLHMRQIKCEVSNEIGTSFRDMRLAVLYGPAYVTHLLPASLQPAPPESGFPNFPNQRQAEQAGGGNLIARWPTQAEFSFARELALGFELGQEIELRCDFDSNPTLQRVLWYKIATNYSIMSEVTPSEADELIAAGAAHAIIHDHPEELMTPPVEAAEGGASHRRRHISWPPEESGAEPNQLEPLENLSAYNLDYEQMSAELLEELDYLERHQHLMNNFVPDPPLIKQLQNSSQVRHSDPLITEPLDWLVRGKPLETTNNQQSNSIPSTTLTLLKPTINLFSAKLNKRSSQISSSSIYFKSGSENMMGRYVCKTEGFPSMARAVYLIYKRQPRVISASTQFATKDSVQVECLVETNAVVDNSTTISWSKNGKQMLEQRVGEKVYTIRMQRSPDLLFLRSILRIERADADDFGIYNCTVTNSINSDHLNINLKSSIQTDYYLIVCTSIAIASVLILLCTLGLLTAFAPRRKFQHSKQAIQIGCPQKSEKLAPKEEDSTDSAAAATAIGCLQQLDRKSLESQDDEGIVCEPPNGIDHHIHQQHNICDNNQLGSMIMSRSVANSMMLRDQLSNNVSSSTAGQQQIYNNNGYVLHQPYDLNCDANCAQLSPIHLRSSLRRQPMQHRSSKFVAIQESMENQLNFNQQQQQQRSSSAYGNGRAVVSSVSSVAEKEGRKEVNQQESEFVEKSQTVSVIDQRSLMNKIFAALLMRSPQQRSSTRRLKSRPIISMPINVSSSSTNIRRSSLSTSLSTLTPADTIVSSIGTNGVVKSAINSNKNHHLLSSSANLIQDSTTASDGTVSSSRSSSSSGQNHESLNLTTYPNYLRQQQKVHWQQSKLNSQPVTNVDNNYPQQNVINEQQAFISDINLYSNQQQQQLALGYNNQAFTVHDRTNWTSSAPQAAEHYQLPAHVSPINNHQEVSSTYVSQADLQQQQFDRACYDTVCNNETININAPPNNNQYGTILQENGQFHQMVPTSDGGEAFIEKHYGTLMSSAYKNLAYPQTNNTKQLSNDASATPSPNSQPRNFDFIHQQAIRLSNSDLIHQQQQHYTDQPVAIVCSNGSTTTTTNKILNDKSLATHV